MDSKDRISIIIPCYNVEKWIMRCFRSILNQTYGFENLEVILIDDLSTDSTFSVLESLQQRYPQNVIAIKSAKKGLCGGTRNLGMNISSGRYITFIDADDCMHPEMLSVLYSKMQEDSYDIVQCKAKCFSTSEPDFTNSGTTEDFYLDLTNLNERKNQILRCTGGFEMCVWAKLYSADFLKDNHIQFLENTYFEDNHFSILCALLAQKHYIVGRELLYYFVNSDGITKSNVSFDKLKHLTYVIDGLYKEFAARHLDTSVAKDCYYELQLFAYWKVYNETLANLERTYLSECEFFKQNLTDNFPDILNNPYFNTFQEPGALKRLAYLKND